MQGWAISLLVEAGAIRECEEHGWMKDRADPHARERSLAVARQDPPSGVSPERAVAAVEDVLNSIGDTCPRVSARRGLGKFDQGAASVQPGPPQEREAACAASRADDDRHFTGGRAATAAAVGLFRHFGWPKPLAL
jgi:hypothetical protein